MSKACDIEDPATAQRSFLRLAEAIPQIVWMAAPDGSCEYINQRWCEYTGLSAEESLGFAWREAIHPEDRARWRDRWDEAVRSGRAYEFAPRIRGADGAYRRFLARAEPPADDEGRPDCWIGTATEIDDRERPDEVVDDRLRASEERYRLAAEAVQGLIYDWDTRSDMVHRSAGLLRLLGFRPEEVPSTSAWWTSRIHPDDRPAFDEAAGRIAEAGDPRPAEYRVRHRDGHWVHVRDHALVRRDAGGAVVRVVGNTVDITDRRLEEEALRGEQERFRLITETIPHLVWSARPDGFTDYYSSRFLDYLGLSLDEMQGWTWVSTLHPEDVPAATAAWERAVAAGADFEAEFRIRQGRDGAHRWHTSRAIPLRDADGRVVRWFGTCTDVDDRRRAEEALRQADRRKDEFLAVLAHELRNPLGPIHNAVQILRLAGARDANSTQAREIIGRQVAHMARLVDDLLDVSRISQGKIVLRTARCDLAAIIRQTAVDYRATVEGHGLTLTVDLPGHPLWVDGDSTRLAQVVSNLLHNAVKFTDRGGSVAVSGRADAAAGAAVVSVRDTGIGMDGTTLRHLFEPFVQANLERAVGGLGLGLALVRGLVVCHGGAVEARSDGPGRGSTFTFRLPLADDPREAATPSTATATGGGLRVLVIEDNKDAAESLRLLLSLAGHQVEVAFDGPAGVDRARVSRPHAILCDIGLPRGMDGYAVARVLRAEPGLASAYLIALTGFGQDDDQRLAREAGFDHHLVKPAEYAALMAALAAVPRRG